MTAPTLTPSFRDFLPCWIARQPWYRGGGVPAIRPVGFFRLEDPAGAVGIETQGAKSEPAGPVPACLVR
jgi:Maltokinase N-terminal cap domain